MPRGARAPTALEPTVESLRRPSVLAAIAAAVIVINVVVLTQLGDDAGVEVEDGRGEPVAEESGDTAASDGAATGDEAAAEQGAATEGAADAEGTGDAAADDAANDSEEEAPDAAGDERTGVPAAGTYAYASSGSWSLTGSGQPEEYQLPETATAVVTVDGGAWSLQLAAGDRYRDDLGFVVGSDAGLDWRSWTVERQFSNGPSVTAYSCSGDSAWYRPDDQGRVVSHDCESDAGITSDGQVEHIGNETIALGDGTEVAADRLLYSYTVTGSGTTQGGVSFEVTGQGQLDLWVDPATGMRLRERRSIDTTTAFDTGAESTYAESVEFTLEALQPS